MKVIKTYPKYLGQYIKFFYSVSDLGDEDIGAIHRRLPDGTLDLLFNLSAGVSISRDGINFSAVPDVSLSGLHPDRSFLQYKEKVYLVGAVLQPGAAHIFVNDNLNYYTSSNLDASLVFGNKIFFLREQLRDLTNDTAKHYLLERFLLDYLKSRKGRTDLSAISDIVNQVHIREGNVQLDKLWKNYNMTERTFRRQFTEFVGMNPKQYASIIRIKSFSQRYEQKRSTFSSVITTLGYTDQAHFSKEFNRIAGTSPTAYFGQLNRVGEEFIHLI